MRDAGCGIGVDGCRGGWIAAISSVKGLRWHFGKSISEIIKEAGPADCILVDMIMGLPTAEEPTRVCDQLAREKLRPHGSRVFNAPIREILTSGSYTEANERSRELTGKGLSKQSFYLFPKIEELDRVLDARIRESHPELVFMRLNEGVPIAASKKTEKGQIERLKLLEARMPNAEAAYSNGLAGFSRSEVARDDLLDALALCWASIEPKTLNVLPKGKTPLDSLGRSKQISF